MADSESSSEYSDSISSSSSSSSESSSEEVVSRRRGRPPISSKKKFTSQPIMVQQLPTKSSQSFTIAKVPMQKKIVKRDRFFDNSRNIPDSVYFGDVKVPLHVLHTRWQTNTESANVSKRVERPLFARNIVPVPAKIHHLK